MKVIMLVRLHVSFGIRHGKRGAEIKGLRGNLTSMFSFSNSIKDGRHISVFTKITPFNQNAIMKRKVLKKS